MTDVFRYMVIFLLLAVASRQIGKLFSSIGLPYITGYLLVGMIAGPFVLGMLPASAVTELRFVDDLSLGVIAFIAGSEFYLKDIRANAKKIAVTLSGVIVVAFPLTGLALFYLTQYLPFAADMPTTWKIALALLGATILLALSPPSTIAVIKEVQASGPFTRTVLGVTVTMDVVIVALFAFSVAIAGGLINDAEIGAGFLGLLLIDIGGAALVGWLMGKLLQVIFTLSVSKWIATFATVVLGYGVFASSHYVTALTAGSAFEMHVEPLLVVLISGFYIANFTTHRRRFEELLHTVGPYIYVAFFTLTGVGIKLDILVQTWAIALALFAIRVVAIYLGSYLGMRQLKEPAKFHRFMGLALITQAGIALGLSREVAIEFPSLGEAFATLVISVVVVNEMFGPIFLKMALKRVGETN